jgi:hypothetical protein
MKVSSEVKPIWPRNDLYGPSTSSDEAKTIWPRNDIVGTILPDVDPRTEGIWPRNDLVGRPWAALLLSALESGAVVTVAPPVNLAGFKSEEISSGPLGKVVLWTSKTNRSEEYLQVVAPNGQSEWFQPLINNPTAHVGHNLPDLTVKPGWGRITLSGSPEITVPDWMGQFSVDFTPRDGNAPEITVNVEPNDTLEVVAAKLSAAIQKTLQLDTKITAKPDGSFAVDYFKTE